MAEDATPLHPDLRKDNVIVHSHMTMGDRDFTYEDGLAKARSGYGPEEIISLEKEYDTPRISHCHIELPVSWAYVDTNGKITVGILHPDSPHSQALYSQALGVPIGRVRIYKALHRRRLRQTSRTCSMSP